MLHASDLRRINRTFECFGRAPNGALRIMWKDLTELFYFIEVDKDVAVLTTKTKRGKKPLLYGAYADWDRHTWQERYPTGGWCLCVWQPPIQRDQFILRYGSMAPYQANGEYKLIENTVRERDDPPNEQNSALLKKLLLDMFYRGVDIEGGPMKETGLVDVNGQKFKSNEVLESLVAQQERIHEATRNQINQEIDDLQPAFRNYKPGKRGGNVSFGGTAA